MFTQQRAPIRSARSSCRLHFSNAAHRSSSSGDSGLLHAPTSAITTSASCAAPSNARITSDDASGPTGHTAARYPRAFTAAIHPAGSSLRSLIGPPKRIAHLFSLQSGRHVTADAGEPTADRFSSAAARTGPECTRTDCRSFSGSVCRGNRRGIRSFSGPSKRPGPPPSV